jgi:hypothetical protein
LINWVLGGSGLFIQLVARFAVVLAVHSLFMVAAQETTERKLFIDIVEGDGAINNVRARLGRETIVEVTDENRKPVGGAIVSFTAPNAGPGGTFTGSGRLFTVTTDESGRATVRNFRPNNRIGEYQIRVTATHQGLTATTAITQSNIIGAAVAGGAASGGLFGIGIPATIAVVGAAVAGTVFGIRAATGGGTSGPTATINVGQPRLP